MISSGVIKQQETQGQDTDSSSPTNDAAVAALSSSHVSSSYMPLYALLHRPRDGPPPYTP